MRRRSYLATVGALLTVGCAGEESSPETDPTVTPARTPTAEPTPAPTGTLTAETTATATPDAPTPRAEPTLVETTPVARWNEYGDVQVYGTTAFGDGAPVVVGTRQRLPVVDGKVDATTQCTVFKDGDRIAKRTEETTELDKSDPFWAHEVAFWFEHDTFERGTHSAELLVQDDRTGNRAQSAPVEFDVVEPLRSHEVSVVDREFPDSIVANEPFSYEVVIRNVSDRDSSIVSSHSLRKNYGKFGTIRDRRAVNLAAGDEFSWEANGLELGPGEYTERLDAVDLTWSYTVERG